MERSSGAVRHFNYANVMSTLAVFLVVGGGAAIAAGVGKNEVGSKQVDNNSLRSADLANNKAVTGKDVRDDSLAGADIDEGSLTLEAGPAGPPGPPGDPATRLFAHVTTAGILGPAQGATSSVRNSQGNYSVTFNRDLTGCVAVANTGLVPGTGFDTFTAGTKTATTIAAASPNTVNVHHYAAGGTSPIDGGLNLAVFC